MNTCSLKLDKLDAHKVQVRSAISTDAVSDYAAAMRDGAHFPAVTVYQSEDTYVLADGHHRLLAARQCGFLDILAEVRPGTKADALTYALSANANHGLRRTTADKNRAAWLAITQWPEKSDREIAKICCIDHHTVAKERRDLEATGEIPQLKKRTGADGKTRKVPAARTKAAAPPSRPSPAAQEKPHVTTADAPPPPPMDPEDVAHNQRRAFEVELEDLVDRASNQLSWRELSTFAGSLTKNGDYVRRLADSRRVEERKGGGS
jgi:ParB-like chromosome segregation protein Spo0J